MDAPARNILVIDVMEMRPLGQPKGAENGKGVSFRKGQQRRCPGSIPSVSHLFQMDWLYG